MFTFPALLLRIHSIFFLLVGFLLAIHFHRRRRRCRSYIVFFPVLNAFSNIFIAKRFRRIDGSWKIANEEWGWKRFVTISKHNPSLSLTLSHSRSMLFSNPKCTQANTPIIEMHSSFYTSWMCVCVCAQNKFSSIAIAAGCVCFISLSILVRRIFVWPAHAEMAIFPIFDAINFVFNKCLIHSKKKIPSSKNTKK